jgi:drug/metabolite transporter (DMT)-like permease
VSSSRVRVVAVLGVWGDVPNPMALGVDLRLIARKIFGPMSWWYQTEDNLILRTFIVLLAAAGLEVGGDALVRIGLSGPNYSIAAGAVTLFAYGIVVNKSGLDFNRLMGVYIAVFFVVSQVVSFVLFKEIPDDRMVLGGGLIVGGGLLILLMT